MARLGRSEIWTDERGAVAALYALALPALVAVAGLGFDYARLASMDTELQNAADQAALAAATQLDRQTGAISRGTSAATGLLTANKTLFANDGKGLAVSDLTVRFYASKANAEACGETGLLTDEDSQAAYVCVAANPRTARYALTPIVGAFEGALGAQAVAGLGSAICRVPPLMICNPSEPLSGDKNAEFDAAGFAGVGLLAKAGGGGAWSPGNFGYLDTDGVKGGGNTELEEALGWTSPPGACVSQSGVDTVDTLPGNHADAADALNTRFDIYDSECPKGGGCPASINSVKDVMHITGTFTGGQTCRIHNEGWQEPSSGQYLPPSNAPLPDTVTPVSMGHPRDICHATDTNQCADGAFGDGIWDWDAYFRSYYGWDAAAWRGHTATGTEPLPIHPVRGGPTRYDVYLWEIAHAGQDIAGMPGAKVLGSKTSGTRTAYGSPQCSPAKGYPPITPGSAADRRRVSVAVVNCVGHEVRGGATDRPVSKWIDVFLVQPSLDRSRTRKDEIYVEIIGETTAGSGGETAGAVVRRDVPYLVR